MVLSDYVIDYTRLNIDQRVLVKSETDGYDFRYTYGLDLVNVKATGEGTNWWAQSVKKCVYSDYVHTDRLGSVVNLTDQYGRVPAQVDYDDWGKVTAYQSLSISGGYRTVLPEITYAGHQYDDVLGMYYAKARMYDAENRRFASVDPVKGNIADPMTMVQYLYVSNNPIIYVDLLGLTAYLIGMTKVNTIDVKGIDYADLNDLMKAYGGKFETTPKTTQHGIRYEGKAALVNIYLYQTPRKELLFVAPYNDWAAEKIESKDIYYNDGKNYISIEYFHKIMCQMGYSKQFDKIDDAPIENIADFKLRYGALLEAKAKEWGVDPNILGGVIYAESRGVGFVDGNLLIRFENHQFRKYLNNIDLYTKYFDDAGMHGGRGHISHKYRTTPASEWQNVHTGDQSSEYAAFELAKSLDITAAYMSASYGVAQIMGFNYKYAGYDNPIQMFRDFSTGYSAQLTGFMNFIENSGLVQYIQNGDLKQFAKIYNGSSEYAEIFSERIEQYKKA